MINGRKLFFRNYRSCKLLTLFVLLASVCLLSAAVVVSVFMVMTLPPDGNGTMDSVDIWVAPDPSQSIVFVTDKSRDCLEMHDPVTNTFLGRLGTTGTGPGEMNRPNGVAVAYNVSTGSGVTDVVFAVERDNHRVSAFSLPDENFIGSFGESVLDKPYGLALYWNQNQLQLWVTDTGPAPDEVVVFDVVESGQGISGNLNFQFEAAGGLESIVIDPVHQLAYICDEGTGSNVMVYDLSGNLITRFGSGLFTDDAEGLVIYDTGNGDGYIIVTDQNATPTEFEVFDRNTYQHLGSFSGTTEGTDGIALTQHALPNLLNGSFYALHSDERVHVYDWSDIAAALGLSTVVIGSPTGFNEPQENVAEDYAVLSNYPNPFNPSTEISYRIDHSAPVHLEIYDQLGKKIFTLVNSVKTAGEYRTHWDGSNQNGQLVSSGIYLARLVVGNRVFTRKLMLQK